MRISLGLLASSWENERKEAKKKIRLMGVGLRGEGAFLSHSIPFLPNSSPTAEPGPGLNEKLACFCNHGAPTAL